MKPNEALITHLFKNIGLGEWVERAACAKLPDYMKNWFMPVGNGVSYPNKTAVQRICNSCPVKEECLRAGKDQKGIWGGLTASERKRRFL